MTSKFVYDKCYTFQFHCLVSSMPDHVYSFAAVSCVTVSVDVLLSDVVPSATSGAAVAFPSDVTLLFLRNQKQATLRTVERMAVISRLQ